jgi:glyoxylase-like metal-dependent hydrolase (beta-lactamase superfamily II)
MKKSAESFSRRDFLAGAAAAGTVYAASKLLPLAAQTQAPSVFVSPTLASDRRIGQPIADQKWANVRQIGRGVYATIGDRTVANHGRSNGGFIVGRDAVLVIEGLQTTTASAFQWNTMRQVTKLPVRAATLSHWHHDHMLGSSYYAAQGAEIWAHAKVPQRIMEIYPRWQAEDRATFSVPWDKRIREAKTDSVRAHAQSDLDGLLSMYDPVKQSVLVMPNHLLDPAKLPMTVDLGGTSVVIEHYVGHTDTDIIVRVPDQNINFMGDVLVAQYPTNINGFPKTWREATAKFATFGKDAIFVPGHGPISGSELPPMQLAIFDDIAAQAKKSFDAGLPVAEAVERYVVPEKWKGLRMFSWGFTVGRTTEQLYAEWGKSVSVLNYS